MPAQRDYTHDDRHRSSSYRDGAPREDRSERRRGLAPDGPGRSAPQPYQRDDRARYAASPPPPPPSHRNHHNGGGSSAPYSRGESSRALDYGAARGTGAFDDRSRQREYSRHNEDPRSRPAPYDDRRRGDPHRSSNRHASPLPSTSTSKAAPSPQPLKSALKRPASPIVEDYDLDPEAEEARLIEERRRKRAAILAKHAGTASSSEAATPAAMAPTPSAAGSVAASSVRGSAEPRARTRSASPATQQVSDAAFSLAKSGVASPTSAAASHAEASAADYNPDDDRLEDEERARARAQPKTLDALAAGTGEAPARLDGAESEYEEIEVTDDEVDDMFALDDEEESKPKKKKIRVRKGEHRQTAIAAAAATGYSNAAGIGAVGPTLTDNFDDADGYYRIVLGERIGEGGRYHVFATLGRGMFSSVVKARDTRPPSVPGQVGPPREREVAIKIVRSQETMYKAGIKEMAILRKLADLDPDDKRHVIRLDGHFEHRGHLCMVFELLSMNLRDVVKRFGKDVGLNLRAVRAYAHQMFLALALMRKANIMHADIKPDNILVNDAKTTLKVCDLGSASDTSEMEITPYLVSRFYRAPEIILGQAYDCSLDMWSIGCTLYELATGKILFPGRTNNQMLLLMQELRGKFTTKQIRKGRFAAQHFDESNNFMSLEKDKSTGADVVRKVTLAKPVRDLKAKLLPGATAKRLAEDELRLHNHFIDLLNRALELDPAKRLTPKEALAHPFLS